MGKEENIAVFKDTLELCKSNVVLRDSIKRSVDGQFILRDADTISVAVSEKRETKVLVSKKRTMEAASAYKGSNVCVLNFASARKPGGGVVTGAGAQEECLCRVSTLYSCLTARSVQQGFYEPHKVLNPLYNADCVFTPGVMVFKSDTAAPKRLLEKDWYSVNVVTCAAPNVGAYQGKCKDSELSGILQSRFRRVLYLAYKANCRVVILGAFGCGVFGNPPSVVANAALDVLKEFSGAFDTVEFAVYCSPKDTTNYDVFRRACASRR